MEEFDVVVANLWRSYALHTTAGLRRAGLRVLVLESVLRPIAAETRRLCVPGVALVQLRRIVPARLRDAVLFAAYRRLDAFAARQCRLGRTFWGFSGQALSALESARRRGLPAILDCGSTHVDWFARRVGQEQARHGPGAAFAASRQGLHRRMREEYAAADLVCVPSGFAASTFVDAGFPEQRIRVNPYGVDADFWRPSDAGAPRGEQPFRAVFTGSLLLRKGLWYLLEAWKKLAPKNAELLLVGNAYPDAIPFLRELPVGVKRIGRVDHATLRSLYRQADLFVLPSLEEGMSRAVLEAMAAGLPVLVTCETGVTEFMVDGEDGRVVPSADADALAQALEWAMQRREHLPELGRNARLRVLPLSWEAYGARAASVLQALS
jgi:alpha-maltose-1-phosphate synthase